MSQNSFKFLYFLKANRFYTRMVTKEREQIHFILIIIIFYFFHFDVNHLYVGKNRRTEIRLPTEYISSKMVKNEPYIFAEIPFVSSEFPTYQRKST